jgi:hypothetical protein
VSVRRRFLVLASAIGIAFVACLLLVERMTRLPADGRSAAAPRSAAPLRPPPATSAPPAQARPEPLGTTAAPPAPASARAGAPERAPAPVSAVGGGPRLEFSFRLDPRLTSGVHLGNRWVSPRTYTRTGDSKSVTVEARARVVGAPPQRRHVAWAASEPDMVEVSPELGDEVKLTVWRPGESRVLVSAGGASGTLIVRAAEVQGALRVDVLR